MYRVGILGYGSMGHTHAGVYHAISERVKIVAVADIRKDHATELAADFGAAVYGDAAELLAAAEVDFVWHLMGEPLAVHASGSYDEEGTCEYIMTDFLYKNAILTAENKVESNIKSLGGYANEILYLLRRIEDPSLPNPASLAEGRESLSLCRRSLSEMKTK